MEIKANQVYKSKRPMRWREIRIMGVIENFVVFTYKEGHPFVYTENDFKQLLKDCQYYVVSELLATYKDGFFDLPKQKICSDLRHNAPSHIYIPQGKWYRHTCPSCGKVTVIYPQQITF